MILIVLASLVASIACQAVSPGSFNYGRCGRRDVVDNNVVGGTPAAAGSHPWIVSMKYGTGATKSHICGGSLINNQWIITAAHCVSGRTTPSYWEMEIGYIRRGQAESWSIKSAVARVIPHPSYSSSTYKNDIAMIKLAAPIDLGSDHIEGVCLYDTTQHDADWAQENATCLASGWGSTFSGGSVVADLREVYMPITSFAAANKYYGSSYDPVTMICAAYPGDGKDTCQGDSGGPVVVKGDGNKWYLVGITSWGYGCGDIGVYTRVSTYTSGPNNWVQQQLDANP